MCGNMKYTSFVTHKKYVFGLFMHMTSCFFPIISKFPAKLSTRLRGHKNLGRHLIYYVSDRSGITSKESGPQICVLCDYYRLELVQIELNDQRCILMTNRNMIKLVYCRYGQQSHVSSVAPSSERRFVSLLCLHRTLRLY